jgi:CubicO group peptidase (beta-lactamase class C family)
VFEIGSVTKVFTGLALAYRSELGRIRLDDPVQRLLREVIVPEYQGRAITVEDLATHRSGLPRLPDNMLPADPLDPYADYGSSGLYRFLEGHTLVRAPGEQYEYSNLGMGLLGHALVMSGAASYGELILDTTGPLRMFATSVAGQQPLPAGAATGFDADLNAAAPWHFDVLEGAGAIRSTVGDLGKLLLAHLGPGDDLLGRAIRLAQSPRTAAGDMGLGWHIEPATGMVWHSGMTGGNASFVAFDPVRKVGVVVLVNAASSGADALGVSLMRMLRGEDHPWPLPALVRLPASILDRYVGQYRLSPELILKVRRNDERLLAQITGQQELGLYALSEAEFYYRAVNAQVLFELGEDGSVRGLVLRQGGAEYPAPRVDRFH